MSAQITQQENYYSICGETSPMVSVICLSYNQASFIDRSLRSVLAQTYKKFEIIYIDNYSKDDSFEIGRYLLSKSGSNHVAHRMGENAGISGGLNYAIQNFAKGKYIATLACDDFWDMYNLEEKVKYFEENTQYGMVYGNGYYYFDNTREIRLFYKNPSISGNILKELLQAPPINPQGILYRHDILKELNYFDEKAKVEDRDLWYRIAEKYPIGYVHEPLTFYRVHGKNVSNNTEYMREGNEYFFKKYESEYPKEIAIARKKQEVFIAYSLAKSTPSFSTFFKIIKNYQPNWPYTKEVARSLYLALRHI
jgi:alpha-1,3-rhamnosyltransferase